MKFIILSVHPVGDAASGGPMAESELKHALADHIPPTKHRLLAIVLE